MGKPNRVKRDYPPPSGGSEPAEVKHLSKRRKREKFLISLVAASEKERAQTRYSILLSIWGCKKMMSGVPLLAGLIEGEHLDGG